MDRKGGGRMVLKLLLHLLLLCLTHAQLLPLEMQALRDIRGSLQDMGGSSFFSSWDFSVDPCTSFSGLVCESLHGLNRIVMLNLGSQSADSTGLTGVLHPSLGSLTFLKQLTVVPGTVTGTIPDSLGMLSELQFLGISQNSITGPIPDSFSYLKSLRVLNLSKNLLSGRIPSGLGNPPNLIAVVLSHNSLNGPIPSFTSPVIHLDLSQNALSGWLPVLPATLEYLSLTKNSLTGSLDPLSSLRNLNYVDLSFNQFIGSVPANLFSLKMSALLLQRNQLSGPILPSSPVSINKIDLSYNSFSGQLSPFLAHAHYLYLNNNNLNGIVPHEFVNSLLSANLQNLYLQHNFFTDISLQSDMSLPTVSSLCIQYNCLVPPAQSACPWRTGKASSRPGYQCEGRHS
ncbi:hypothetical protein O6H91_Y063600 [Diphasiastrum complanatum]|nr:hypothetical protein O6H91_Y063600 [Diphasiastrum complanatum]